MFLVSLTRTSNWFNLHKGPTHRLEILPPLHDSQPQFSSSALQLTDLALEEEEALHGRINNYERKIDDMLTEVASLKTEVRLFSSLYHWFVTEPSESLMYLQICVCADGETEAEANAWSSLGAAERLPKADCRSGGGADWGHQRTGSDGEGEHTSAAVHGEDTGHWTPQVLVFFFGLFGLFFCTKLQKTKMRH